MFIQGAPMVRSQLKVLLDRRNIARIEAGLPPESIRQFARECGLPPSVISNLIANRIKRADYSTLDRLCHVLKCQVGDILVYSEEN